VALVTSPLVIRSMGESGVEVISAAFTAIGWGTKPSALFRCYLDDGRRLASVAERHGEFVDHVTLL
jgi:hypothetical protein